MKKYIIILFCLLFMLPINKSYAIDNKISKLILNSNKHIAHFLKNKNIDLLFKSYNLIKDSVALDCDLINSNCIKVCKDCKKDCQTGLDNSNKIIKNINYLMAIIENMKSSLTKINDIKKLKQLQVDLTNTKKIILTCNRLALKSGAHMTEIESFEPPKRNFYNLPDSFDSEPASPI